MSDQKRIAYDLAQKLGERMDRLEACSGWSKVIMPEIAKELEIAQNIINNIDTDIRIADYNRGILKMCETMLAIVDEKRKSAQHNMASNLNPL